MRLRRSVLHLLNSFERCEDFRCLTWRPVGQSPWTARDPLVALPLAVTRLSIVWLPLVAAAPLRITSL